MRGGANGTRSQDGQAGPPSTAKHVRFGRRGGETSTGEAPPAEQPQHRRERRSQARAGSVRAARVEAARWSCPSRTATFAMYSSRVTACCRAPGPRERAGRELKESFPRPVHSILQLALALSRRERVVTTASWQYRLMIKDALGVNGSDEVEREDKGCERVVTSDGCAHSSMSQHISSAGRRERVSENERRPSREISSRRGGRGTR